MKYLFFTIFLSILGFFSVSILAQKPQPTIAPPSDDVVKITTNLVQIDALVTTKDGSPVTDLNLEDFEILQDGKPQRVVGVKYFNNQQILSKNTEKPTDKNIPTSPTNVTEANAGRILTFIVDDGNCRASLFGMRASREALEKFVNEQMQSNDLLAIYQTRSGSSMLQQYSSNKTLLLQTIKKIRWYPAPGSCSSDGSFFERATPNLGVGDRPIESEQDIRSRKIGEDFNRNSQTVGTIGVVNYVIKGLEQISGRKVVFFLSDGISLRSTNNISMTAIDALRDLTDVANRASIVFNTIDVRGLVDTSLIEARDGVTVKQEITPGRATGTEAIVAQRTQDLRSSQEGLFFLANETGGNFFQGSNNLDVPIRKALDLESGYYLIGYEPDDETFKGKKFHKIEIKVKRPSLKVTSRSGFLSKIDVEEKPKNKTADSELYQALVAPLPKAGLNLRLTAFFSNTQSEGNFVRSIVSINGEEITFADESNGIKKAVFDVVAVTLDEKNRVVDEFNRTHTIKVDDKTANTIKSNGLVYSVDVPIKKDGIYTLRVAMRDANSRLLGSASQTIPIPNLQKSTIFLSGLNVSQADENGKFTSASLTKPENGFVMTESKSIPAIRQFKQNSILAYSYNIYNAEINKSNNQPNISIQVKLYKDGNIVSDSTPQPAKIEMQSDLKRINDYGFIHLPKQISTGDYVLQIIIKDLQNNASSSQWVDFEVIN